MLCVIESNNLILARHSFNIARITILILSWLNVPLANDCGGCKTGVLSFGTAGARQYLRSRAIATGCLDELSRPRYVANKTGKDCDLPQADTLHTSHEDGVECLRGAELRLRESDNQLGV